MNFSQTWLYKEATILNQPCVHDISHLTQGSWRESLPRPPSTLALMVVLEERESIADIIWRENEPKVIRWDQELTLQTATFCTTETFFQHHDFFKRFAKYKCGHRARPASIIRIELEACQPFSCITLISSTIILNVQWSALVPLARGGNCEKVFVQEYMPYQLSNG